MYDKSKRTWSQRLKISKTEKTHTTATTTTTSVTTGFRGAAAASSSAAATASTSATANNARSSHKLTAAQFQTTTAMHLLSDYHGSGAGGGGGVLPYEYLPSALSRSMKYAEPWIYGTVRGIPARPYQHQYQHLQLQPGYVHPHAATIFAAHPLAGSTAGTTGEAAVALVICSCPEYLSGTKRDVKKASVCKKCKGSRLPLATFGGGTVRLAATANSSILPTTHKLRSSGAPTMRLVSHSKKPRPSILDSQKDPYDLMRRTRLLSPEPGTSGGADGELGKEKSRSRGKSASPTRGRSRTRPQLPGLKKSATTPENATAQPGLPDCWLVEDADTVLSGTLTPTPSVSSSSGGRRSILRCNVNPYDLISVPTTKASGHTAAAGKAGRRPRGSFSVSHNEFKPPNDDFNVEDAALYDEAPPFATHSNNNSFNNSGSNAAPQSKSPKSTKINVAKGGGGNEVGSVGAGSGSIGAAVTDSSSISINYSNVQAIAGQRISLGEQSKTTKKSLIKQSEAGHSYERIVIDTQRTVEESAAKTEAKAATPLKPQQNQAQQPKRPPRVKRQDSSSGGEESVESVVGAEEHSDVESSSPMPTVVCVTPSPNIKSILKRPVARSPDAAVSPDLLQDIAEEAIPKDNGKHQTPAAEQHHAREAVIVATISGSATANSQFYIPLPQTRKKVQFMVEEKVVLVAENPALTKSLRQKTKQNSILNEKGEEPLQLDADECVASDGDYDEAPTTAGLLSTHNYEYYRRKREEDQLFSNKQITTTTTTTTAATSAVSVNECQRKTAETPAADSNSPASALNEMNAANNNNNPAAADVGDGNGDGNGDGDDDVYDGNENEDDDEHYFDASEAIPLTGRNGAEADAAAAASTLYEDVLPAMAATAATSAPQPNKPPVTNNNKANGVAVGSSKDTAAKADVLSAAAKTSTASVDGDDDKPAAEQSVLGESADDRAKQQQQQLQTAAASDNSKGGKAQQQPARNPIRRAHSERQTCHGNKHNGRGRQHADGKVEHASCGRNGSPANSNNVNLKFKDTMALRYKKGHSDARELFACPSSSHRPKEPPPPPPPSPPQPAEASGVAPTAATSKLPATAAVLATEDDKATATALSLSPAETTTEQQQVSATTTNTNTTATGNDRSKDATNTSEKHQQQQKEQQKQQTATLNNQKQLAHKGGSASCQEIKAAIDSNSRQKIGPVVQQQKQQQQRTVVRVAPFNKTSSEVHRLKITHTDVEEPTTPTYYHPNSPTSPHQLRHNSAYTGALSAAEEADLCTQKKTSILITGDDCYSTMNLSADASTPLYQSSVVVADCSSQSISAGLRVTTSANTVTINVSSPRSDAEEIIYQHNKFNALLSRQAGGCLSGGRGAIIPIRGTAEVNLQRSASSTSSNSTSSITSNSSSGSGSVSSCGDSVLPKRGRTLIRLDYQEQRQMRIVEDEAATITTTDLVSHEAELLKILRNPVEAVKRNLVPHICGKQEAPLTEMETARSKKMKDGNKDIQLSEAETKLVPCKMNTLNGGHDATSDVGLLRNKLPPQNKPPERCSFIAKLLEDPMLSQVADGLETETVAELIENSLRRLQASRNAIDISGTKDSEDMNRLINISLQKVKEERQATNSGPCSSSACVPVNNAATSNEPAVTTPPTNHNLLSVPVTKDEDRHSNRGSISSANSFASASNYEMFDFDPNNESDCYQSCSSEITSAGGDEDADSVATRSKFYQMLVDATLAEIEMSTNLEELDGDDANEHHYESIHAHSDPIYEEITDVPPPLPLSAPPLNDPELEKKTARSIFEGASKYDILSYLVDAKERGLVREESFEYPPPRSNNPIIIEEEATDTLSDLGKRKHTKDLSCRSSIVSDSSEDTQSNMSSLSPPLPTFMCGANNLLHHKGANSEIERNDSGVGSETSKCSRSKYQQSASSNCAALATNGSAIHLCEDCESAMEAQLSDALVCRKCGKKRVERKEIITEVVETEEKYGRDLQIILEEFCQPMLVAGLLTQEQLSAIFLNTEELLENNQTLAERMRDALDIALEQGDDDLLTVNIGRIFLDFTQMLHAFERYCVRQAGASLLLANLEKEKELLRIFLKVSQMENAVLRRMNLNSFLMVPVQRVTKYPLLLARLYKVTPAHLEGRDLLKQAQEKIELHLNHINQEAKDVPTKLWRRISSSSPNRRASCEIDMINIKLRKMAIDILEWNHDEVRFAMEGKLLYTQPTDSNWKKARTIKLTPVNALLVTNGKPSANYKAEKVTPDKLSFPKHTGIREASLLVMKEKCGRYTLIHEPLYLDRCIVCSEADWDDYFEVQEISSKDTFIFKAEDGVRTKQWYTQLQYHAQGMGAWRKRRNALANIMINGMLARS